MSDVAIRVEGLGKEYHLGAQKQRYHTLGDQIRKFTSIRNLLRRGKRAESRPPFWALKDVSFEVKKGEAVGIIGRNGAGKSTLLKILSRITEPTTGEVDIHGRVGSLLEVGTGFHPELTGRENIYLNGAILGMRRSEIVRKFDEIVAFAEVDKFVDTPVKHYSSGMYTRLAFSVAAHLEPEILIVDEVLAVGDAQFQKKCMGKMGEVAGSGRTVLFVSHNMAAIQALCTTAVHLRSGHVIHSGAAGPVISDYLKDTSGQGLVGMEGMRVADGLQLTEIAFAPRGFPSGSATNLTLRFRADSNITITGLCVLMFSTQDVRVAVADLRSPDGPYRLKSGETFSINTRFPRVPFVEGEYKIGLYCEANGAGQNHLDLTTLEIGPPEQPPPVIAYPPSYPGFVEIEHSSPMVTINSNSQEKS